LCIHYKNYTTVFSDVAAIQPIIKRVALCQNSFDKYSLKYFNGGRRAKDRIQYEGVALINDPYKQKGELIVTFIVQGPNITTKNPHVLLEIDNLLAGRRQ
jgi:hypothetical protein